MEYYPRGVCWKWDPTLIYSYATGELNTFIVYVTIPVLVWLTARKFKLQYQEFVALPIPNRMVRTIAPSGGAFVLLCGIGHFLNIVNLWIAIPWLTVINSVLTGIASWVFVIFFRKFTNAAAEAFDRLRAREKDNPCA